MAFNGDGPHTKRQRTETDSANNRGHTGNYTATEEPRRKRQDETKPNHVLLFTIINPMYPITVDVLHTICQASGQVLRIVIFKKNGVQAMVEFDSIESAMRAKETLNGADIYSGCCTLKIDFAKPEKLNVHKNDSESWDYTVSINEYMDECPSPSTPKQQRFSVPRYIGDIKTPDFNTPRRAKRNLDVIRRIDAKKSQKITTLRKQNAYLRKRITTLERLLDHLKEQGLLAEHAAEIITVAAEGSHPTSTSRPPLFDVPLGRRVSDDGRPATYRVKENTNGRPQPLLQEPHYGSRPQPYNPYPSEQQRYDEMCAGPGYGEPFGTETYRKSAPPSVTAEFRDQRNTHFQQPGAVLMVYGLDPLRTNADKLFNLMCLYGNVARIKFLKSKEGTAMVQMGDSVAVERCVQNLNNVTVGLTGAAPLISHHTNASDEKNILSEHKLQLAFSKQPYLSEVTNPYPLPDKSPSYKEYITNKNNRFMNPAMASKNRIQPPSKILHFFNTPPQVTETELIQVFQDYDVVPPKAVKLFPMKSERSSSGLLEFENTTEAVAAVMACNHAAIESPGTKFPFIMKLCFSSSRSMTIRNGDNNSNGSGDKRIEGEH